MSKWLIIALAIPVIFFLMRSRGAAGSAALLCGGVTSPEQAAITTGSAKATVVKPRRSRESAM